MGFSPHFHPSVQYSTALSNYCPSLYRVVCMVKISSWICRRSNVIPEILGHDVYRSCSHASFLFPQEETGLSRSLVLSQHWMVMSPSSRTATVPYAITCGMWKLWLSICTFQLSLNGGAPPAASLMRLPFKSCGAPQELRSF